ncbi:MAG: pectate lyase, partial [Pirellula sp.]
FGSRNGTGVTASPRDFARIGWLWLNRGNWNGKQIIKSQLMDEFLRAGVSHDLPRTTDKGEDYLKIGSYGGGTNQTPYGPGVYGFNLWFNNKIGSGERVWPELPDDAFQANGMWNRDTLTIIPSWRMVIASRNAKPGKFEPGTVDGQYNQNLRLISAFARRTPQQPVPASTADVPRWQPHDFKFRSITAIDNPFQIDFAAKVTRPDGSTFSQPGFYDGENVWKVRISGSYEGVWSLETQSNHPELHGHRATLRCTPNSNQQVHGGLQIDPQHPRHFRLEDGSRFYMLAYECDWLWVLDSDNKQLPTVNPFLDRLQANGFNYVILNSYAHDTSWRPGKSEENDFGPPPNYPWAGSNEQPDHSRLNVQYWQHYDRIIEALHRRGMMAHIFLKVYNKKVKWPERGSPNDDLYFRSMVARYSAFPNVIWDFSKEAHNEKDLKYKLSRIQLVRSADAYDRLITNHDDNANYDAGEFDKLVDFRTDQQHSKLRETLLAQRSKCTWPIANVEFGYEQGPGGPEDKTYRVTQKPDAFVAKAWEVAMSGGYTAYYYTYTAWDVLRPEHQPTGYQYFGNLRKFFETTQYHRLEPIEAFSNVGWTLADPGWEYVVYVPNIETVELTLPQAKHRFEAVCFHPLKGTTQLAGSLEFGLNRVKPPAEWTGPAVLHITQPKPKPIDTTGFNSSKGHWRNLRDDSRFITVEPSQPSYMDSQVREIVENILLFQRKNGGWPKDYDMSAVLTRQQHDIVRQTHDRDDTSYDNDNIHSQVEYLARAYSQCDIPEWRAACERGFDFIVRSQYANGGIPQRFPQPKSYHAHITFNDGAMMGVLDVLSDVANRKPHFSWVDARRREQAADSVKRGVECILNCQIMIDGKKTGWCQQHDEKTFEARSARTFELASICPQETTSIVRFLMRLPNPSQAVTDAVDAAVQWLTSSQLNGVRTERIKAEETMFLRHKANFDLVVVADPNAPPIWARHYEIETGRPIFAGRDGIKKYSLAEIERERRTGSAWYGGWPVNLLQKEYPLWKNRK